MRYRATVSSKNQVTLPAAVRKRLGIGAGSKIDFVIDGDVVRLKPVKELSISDFFGMFPAIPGASADFKREIDEMWAAEANKIAAEMSRS